MRGNRRGTILITLGILMIAAALGLAGYNLWDARRAEEAADQITEQLVSDIGSKVENAGSGQQIGN